MKPGSIAIYLLVAGVLFGVISPADITETLKATTYTLFKTTGELDYQVESSNNQVREMNRPWNQIIKFGQ